MSINAIQKEVRIYTRANCQYCDYAKELLKERGIAFNEYDVGEDYVLRGWLAWATGQKTLPQIFIGGEPVGGFADLMTLDATHPGGLKAACLDSTSTASSVTG